MKKITQFDGPHAVFSNFHPSPLLWMGRQFPSVEQPFQASKHPRPEEPDAMELLDPKHKVKLHAKTLLVARKDFRDMPVLDIFTLLTPGQAKRLGRAMSKRPDWDSISPAIMFALLLQKFSIPKFRNALLETGSAIIEEGNTWNDTLWGICPPGSGTGQNRLGRLLMAARELIASNGTPEPPQTISDATSHVFLELTKKSLTNAP